MRTSRCFICRALVHPDDERFHTDWHARLERAIKGIPEPPPLPKPL